MTIRMSEAQLAAILAKQGKTLADVSVQASPVVRRTGGKRATGAPTDAERAAIEARGTPIGKYVLSLKSAMEEPDAVDSSKLRAEGRD